MVTVRLPHAVQWTYTSGTCHKSAARPACFAGPAAHSIATLGSSCAKQAPAHLGCSDHHQADLTRRCMPLGPHQARLYTPAAVTGH